MIVLGIESSCDDTACAVLDGEGRVLNSVVSSQLAAHRPYGGVVPEIASREHLANWSSVSRAALGPLNLRIRDFDVIAATQGPGLVGSLLVGLSLAKAMAFSLNKPFHGVHHLEGHLYSPFLRTEQQPAETIPGRFVGLVVSGGHTALYDVEKGSVNLVGQTRDDALGECFDKVGKRLNLPYPAGPIVDQLAESGDPTPFPMTVPRLGGGLEFSYSGLKSRALRDIEALEDQNHPVPVDWKEHSPYHDLLAGFRRAAIEQIMVRLKILHAKESIPLLAVSGGAAANRLLRRRLTTWCESENISLRLVPLQYCSDNAAMIAFAALLRQRRGISDDPLATGVFSRQPIGST